MGKSITVPFLGGIIILLLTGIIFTIVNFLIFGNATFGPNIGAEGAGIAFSTALTLITILIGLKIENTRRDKALNATRFLFLRKKAEQFKNVFANYVDLFGSFPGIQQGIYLLSWESFTKKYWPVKIDELGVRYSLNDWQLKDNSQSKRIMDSFNALFTSLESIVESSSEGVFEGRENLIQKRLLPALFNLGYFRSELIPLTGNQSDTDSDNLQKLSKISKEGIFTSIDVLNALCELSNDVKAPLDIRTL
jgi:hypothetical protein